MTKTHFPLGILDVDLLGWAHLHSFPAGDSEQGPFHHVAWPPLSPLCAAVRTREYEQCGGTVQEGRLDKAPSSGTLSGHHRPPSGTRGLEAAATLGVQEENKVVGRPRSNHPARAGSVPGSSTDALCWRPAHSAVLCFHASLKVLGGVYLLHRYLIPG